MAFAIMPMVLNVGFVVAPAITGLLSDPYGVVGKEKHGNSLLERFPFALPNILATATFLACFVLVFLLLEESLASKRGRKDIGITLKDKLLAESKKLYFSATKKNAKNHQTSLDDADRQADIEPLLQHTAQTDEETARQGMAKLDNESRPPPWKDVFNRQSVYCMFAYSMLALHSGSYDMLLPLLMHHPEREAESWFKFSGGFGVGKFTFLRYTTPLTAARSSRDWLNVSCLRYIDHDRTNLRLPMADQTPWCTQHVQDHSFGISCCLSGDSICSLDAWSSHEGRLHLHIFLGQRICLQLRISLQHHSADALGRLAQGPRYTKRSADRVSCNFPCSCWSIARCCVELQSQTRIFDIPLRHAFRPIPHRNGACFPD